jgi:RNA polymerase sigma-70 factor (ECF subfamily)
MPERFDTTRWSVVLAARDATGESARKALAWLCEAYWHPVYAFVRRRGYGPEEAADLTQGYFARLIEKRDLKQVRPELGKFRSFVLKSVQHYVSNERDRERALKRGGGRGRVSLDGLEAERRLALEPRDDLTPEALFERTWALAVLERSIRRLSSEASAKGRLRQFEILGGFLTEAGGPSYADAGRELGMDEPAVKVAVHRLRRRFGEHLRAEIAETVAEPGGVDAEVRHLLSILERTGSRAP